METLIEWWQTAVAFLGNINPAISALAALLTIVVIIGSWVLWLFQRRKKEQPGISISAGRNIVGGNHNETHTTIVHKEREESKFHK